MEARLQHAALLASIVLSLGASYRTENFIVSSPQANFSREVAQAAEKYRRDLAIEWLGDELEPWRDPCPIRVQVGRMGAGGATSFMFDQGRPTDWSMSIQGSRQRILDSVLPHEVTHTIFATHFGRPLPRWADEGACTTVEHQSEKQKQKRMLVEFLTTGRGIAFNRMFAMKEYPQDIMPLYSQGYSLARFLIAQGGKKKFMQYVGDGMQSNNWPETTRKHYGFRDLSDLQVTWLEWVRQGSPPIRPQDSELAQQQSRSDQRDDGQLAMVSQDRANAAAGAPSGSARSAPSSEPAGQATAGPAKPTAQLASTRDARPKSGWYARVRDTARSGEQQEGGQEQQAGPSSKQSAPDPGTSVPGGSLSRPQPVGRPEQVILEWSRQDRRPAPAHSGQSQQQGSRPKAYLVAPEQLKETIRR